MSDQSLHVGDDFDVDLRMILFALVHKLSPGKPVVLAQADLDAAWAAFPGDRPALSTTVIDGTIHLAVVGAAGRAGIESFQAARDRRLQ